MADVETDEESVEEFMSGALDDETVDTSDLPDEEATEETETTEEPEVTTDGPARDEHGRFVKKDTETTEEEAPEEKAEVAEEEPAAESSEAPAAEATPEPEVAPEPVTVKVSGKDFVLEGFEYRPGKGATIKDEQVPFYRQMIQEGAYYKQNWKTLEQTAEKRGYDKALADSPEVQQSKAMMAQIDHILTNEEAAIEFFTNYQTQAPLLRERALRQIAEDRAKQYESRGKEQEDTVTRERIEQEKHVTLSNTMTELKSVPDLKILTNEDWSAIDRHVQRLNQRNALFVTQEDGTYLDTAAIEEIAKDILALRKQAVEAAKKAEEAAKFNARNKPKPTAPKASAAAVTPRTGSAQKKAVEKEDYRDVAEAFLKGKLDQD